MNPLAYMLIATAITIIGAVAFLAIVQIGIARQENASSLASRPHGLAAALARRLLARRAEPPSQIHPARRARAHATTRRKRTP